MMWVLEKRVYGRSAGPLQPKPFTWVADENYQPFATAAEARRALMEGLEPGIVGQEDHHIARHWRKWQANVGTHRLSRLRDEPRRAAPCMSGQ